jgi:hypothetical protein
LRQCPGCGSNKEVRCKYSRLSYSDFLILQAKVDLCNCNCAMPLRSGSLYEEGTSVANVACSLAALDRG